MTFLRSSANTQSHSDCKSCQAGQWPDPPAPPPRSQGSLEKMLEPDGNLPPTSAYASEVGRAMTPGGTGINDPNPTKAPWRACESKFLGSG